MKPVLLVGSVGAGADDIAWAEIEQTKSPVLLQPTVDTLPEEIIASLVAQIVHGIEPTGIGGFEGNLPAARRARLNLARRYGPDASIAIDAAKGDIPSTWTLADAIGANAGRESMPPLHISITNAHRMPEPLLWELRDLVNAGLAILIATTHREHLASRFGAESPLYGNYTAVEIPKVEPHNWARGLPEPVSPSDAEFLLAITRARASSTIDVLSFWEPGRSIRSAWSLAVSARRHEAENVLNLAAGVHRYAPRLLIAIASRQAPYGAIVDAPSQGIARALTKLRDIDLIEQPVQRTWQIADPVLQGALLSHAMGMLASGAHDPLLVSPDYLG